MGRARLVTDGLKTVICLTRVARVFKAELARGSLVNHERARINEIELFRVNNAK